MSSFEGIKHPHKKFNYNLKLKKFTKIPVHVDKSPENENESSSVSSHGSSNHESSFSFGSEEIGAFVQDEYQLVIPEYIEYFDCEQPLDLTVSSKKRKYSTGSETDQDENLEEPRVKRLKGSETESDDEDREGESGPVASVDEHFKRSLGILCYNKIFAANALSEGSKSPLLDEKHRFTKTGKNPVKVLGSIAASICGGKRNKKMPTGRRIRYRRNGRSGRAPGI